MADAGTERTQPLIIPAHYPSELVGECDPQALTASCYIAHRAGHATDDFSNAFPRRNGKGRATTCVAAARSLAEKLGVEKRYMRLGFSLLDANEDAVDDRADATCTRQKLRKACRRDLRAALRTLADAKGVRADEAALVFMNGTPDWRDVAATIGDIEIETHGRICRAALEMQTHATAREIMVPLLLDASTHTDDAQPFPVGFVLLRRTRGKDPFSLDDFIHVLRVLEGADDMLFKARLDELKNGLAQEVAEFQRRPAPSQQDALELFHELVERAFVPVPLAGALVLLDVGRLNGRGFEARYVAVQGENFIDTELGRMVGASRDPDRATRARHQEEAGRLVDMLLKVGSGKDCVTVQHLREGRTGPIRYEKTDTGYIGLYPDVGCGYDPPFHSGDVRGSVVLEATDKNYEPTVSALFVEDGGGPRSAIFEYIDSIAYQVIVPLATLAFADGAASRERRRRNTEMIGESREWKNLEREIYRVSRNDATVIVHGESGTGKELVVREIHASSRRRKGPLVTLNCSGLGESLADSELFGHEKGAFTSATSTKPGLFEVANGGTLFLDEIGELPKPVQAKLLRALQEREIRRVGGVTDIPVDVRVIVATHRNLSEMVKAGTFREDLYYRLKVLTLELPTLRRRGKRDITALAGYFLRRGSPPGSAVPVLTPGALAALHRHSWPGNVRELENVVQNALTHEHQTIRESDLDLPPVADQDSLSDLVLDFLDEQGAEGASMEQIRGAAGVPSQDTQQFRNRVMTPLLEKELVTKSRSGGPRTTRYTRTGRRPRR